MKKNQRSVHRFLRTLAAAAFTAAAAVPAGSLVADTIDIPAGTTQEYTLTNTTGVIDAHTFTGAGTLILTLTKSDTRVASNFDNFTGTIRFQNAADAPYGVKVNSESSTFSSNANITLDITDGASIYVNSVLENDVYVIGSGSGNQENRGAIRLSNTISGDIYLKGNTTFGLETGRANGTISGSAASGETQTLTLGTAPTALNAAFNGVISDGANGGKLAVVVAYGTPTFNAANTFTGGLTVNANAVAKLGDAARVAGNYQINDGGRLEMNFSNSGSNFANMTFTGGGTVKEHGRTDEIEEKITQIAQCRAPHKGNDAQKLSGTPDEPVGHGGAEKFAAPCSGNGGHEKQRGEDGAAHNEEADSG